MSDTDMPTDRDPDREALVEAALLALLRATSPHDTDLNLGDLPTVTGATGTPVDVTIVSSYNHVAPGSLSRGVHLELSDGSGYGLSIGVYRRPAADPRPASGPPPHHTPRKAP